MPGWAPTKFGLADVLTSTEAEPFAQMPYVEWYENSLRFEHSPVAHYHREHFGRLSASGSSILLHV